MIFKNNFVEAKAAQRDNFIFLGVFWQCRLLPTFERYRENQGQYKQKQFGEKQKECFVPEIVLSDFLEQEV